MKRILLTIFVLLFTVGSFAQEHMTFKGVEIDGTPDEMVEKLSKVGFKYEGLSEEEVIYYMKVKFAGYQSRVGIMSSNSLVHSVAAAYSDGLRTWAHLLERFNFLEEMLTIKYGKPSSVNKNIGKASDGRYPIRDGKGEWKTTWETDKGNIMLYIYVTEGWHQTVVIGYMDKINVLSQTQQFYDDL